MEITLEVQVHPESIHVRGFLFYPYSGKTLARDLPRMRYEKRLGFLTVESCIESYKAGIVSALMAETQITIEDFTKE